MDKATTLFPMNLQHFAEGSDGVTGGTDGNSSGAVGGTEPQSQTSLDVAGLTNLINQFNAQQQQTAGTQQDTQQDTQQATQQNTDPQQNPNSEGAQHTEPTQAQKDANAFAQMRIQNRQLTEALGKIAKANNIQYTDSTDLLAKLNDDSVTKLAQQQGVPKELLMRLETLETQNQQFVQAQRQANLTQQFTALQEKYGLNEQQLTDFATQMSQSGINPMLQDVNIENEYLSRNFNAIVEARIQAAVQAALTKDQQASASGTQPNAVQGSPASGAAQQYNINTTAGLEQLLATMPK